MEKIRIITDSASDLTAPHRGDVTVLPMRITFGAQEYFDGVTLGHREFYEKLIESDELPTTSLVNPAQFGEAFAAAVEAGEKVVVVTLSGKLSGTYQSAVLAAEEFPGQVHVVDSMNVTIGERMLIDCALRMKDEGRGAAKIAAALEELRHRVHIVAVLDTLEYLKKGGRIPKAAAFIGEALAIKPVVTLREGEIVMLGKARGSRNGNNYLMKEIERAGGVDFSMPYYLAYTGLDDAMLQKYVEDSRAIWEGHTDELPVCTIGATIGTHVGPNAVAVAFFSARE